MPLEARLLVGLTLAMAIAYAATPVAIRIAAHFDFYDVPVGYKGHRTPTPYLGGAAVISAFVVVVARAHVRAAPDAAGARRRPRAVGRRHARRPPPRAAPGSASRSRSAWRRCSGRPTSAGRSASGAAVDLLATAVWVVAVVNAFNLFDNMDGASSTMAGVVARRGRGARARAVRRLARRDRRRAVRRLPGLPAAQPLAPVGADLPRRRRQHADRLRDRGARDDRRLVGGGRVAGARHGPAARRRAGAGHVPRRRLAAPARDLDPDRRPRPPHAPHAARG